MLDHLDNNSIKNLQVKRNEIEQVQKEQVEYKILGTFCRTRGLKLFYWNSKTGELFEAKEKVRKTAKMEVLKTGIEAKNQSGKEITIDGMECIYFEALNVKSAVGKYHI